MFAGILPSLSATFFRNRIIGALRSSNEAVLRKAAQDVPANLIFDFPSVTQLAKALHGLVDPSAASDLHDGTTRSAEAIKAMVAKYTADLPSPHAAQAKAHKGNPVVLLTGSTGNIGSHILASLLSEGGIGKIYTLNRSSADPSSRLKQAFEERGLPVKLLEDPRLVSLFGDINEDNFALEASQYKEVRMPHYSTFMPMLK